jgi:hypothetical protein
MSRKIFNFFIFSIIIEVIIYHDLPAGWWIFVEYKITTCSIDEIIIKRGQQKDFPGIGFP